MRKRLHVILVFTVWFMTTGGHWDLLQVVAWIQMFVQNSAQMSLGRAVVRTLDPQEMCGLCHIVRDAKNDQGNKATLGSQPGAKALLIVQMPDEIVVTAPAGSMLRVSDTDPVMHGRAAPPVPPPRLAA